MPLLDSVNAVGESGQATQYVGLCVSITTGAITTRCSGEVQLHSSTSVFHSVVQELLVKSTPSVSSTPVHSQVSRYHFLEERELC